MGLYASFSLSGFPDEVSTDFNGEELSVPIDYSPAYETFVETFMSVATTLVPVDTGYLQSTINAWADEDSAEAEATAEYAQYVEYGTWKMAAQPYFEPALQQAQQAAIEVAIELQDEANEMLQDMMEEVLEEFMAEFSDGSFLGDVGSMLLGGAFLLLMFPILVNVYGIMQELSQPFQNTYSNGSQSNLGGGGVSLDIMIT